MTCPPQPVTVMHESLAPTQSVEGLDYGGPAVVEPRLLRPETLRRHLSVGLPFANPNAVPGFQPGGLISNTTPRAPERSLTPAFATGSRLKTPAFPSGAAHHSVLRQNAGLAGIVSLAAQHSGLL